MDSTLVLEFPTGYSAGQEVHHPDDPPGEWDWLINLLLGPIQSRLWASFSGYVQGQFSQLLGPLYEIRDRVAWLLAAIYQIPSALHQRLGEIRDRITEALSYWFWRLLSSLDALRDRAVASLQSAPWIIIQGVQDAIRWLISGLGSIPHIIGGYLQAQFPSLYAVLSNIPGALIGGLVGPILSVVQVLAGLPHTISGGFQAALAWVQAAINSLPDRMHQIWVDLQLAFWRNVADLWAELTRGATGITVSVLNMGTRVLVGAIDVLSKGPPPELQAVTDRLTATLETGLATIQSQLLGQGQVTPERAPEVAVRAFLTASAIGMGAHVLSTAIELAHPLRYVGLHYLSGFLGTMGSFQTVSYAAMGVMVREAVANPMAYNVRARTRPTIPTAGDLQAMRRKHNISASEFGSHMAYQGYSDWWIQRFEEYLPADPRLYDVLRMADTYLPKGAPPADAIPLLERLGIKGAGNDDWWLEMKFALAGYNWIDIPQLIQTVKSRLDSTERSRLVTTTSLRFRYGELSEDQYRLELSEAGLNDSQITWRVRAEQHAAIHDDISDLTNLFTDQYLKDVLTEEELQVALVNSGLTPRKASILTARAVIRKYPKPTTAAKTEEEADLKKFQTKASELYRRQYQADLITADDYYNSLVAIGITARLAAVTVQVEMTKKQVEATAVAIKAEEKAATATRSVYEKLYKEQFQAGELDVEGYYQLLLDVGMPAEQAQGTVALELVKQYDLSRRAELKEEEALALKEQKAQADLYVRRYRAGDITADVLLDRLLGLEISPILAETTVALEELKREEDAEKVLSQIIIPALKVPFDLAVATLKAQLSAGEISRDDFVLQLLESGLAEATVALIAEVLG